MDNTKLPYYNEHHNHMDFWKGIYRRVLDEKGVMFVMELLLNASQLNSDNLLSDLEEVKEKITNSSLNFVSEATDETLVEYNPLSKQVSLFAGFVDDKINNKMQLVLASDKSNLSGENAKVFAEFDTTRFTKDAFLKDVQVVNFNEDSELEDDVKAAILGDTEDETEKYGKYLVFKFNIKDTTNDKGNGTKVESDKVEVIAINMTELFSGDAADIVIGAIGSTDSGDDDDYTVSYPDGATLQDVIEDFVGFFNDIYERLNQLDEEISRFVPFTREQIQEMFNKAAGRAFSEKLANGGDVTLTGDLNYTGKDDDGNIVDKYLVVKSDTNLNLDGNTFTAGPYDYNGTKYYDTIVVDPKGGDVNFEVSNGNIKGIARPEAEEDIEAFENGAIVFIQAPNGGNVNVSLKNVNFEGERPVYVLADKGTANVVIDGGVYDSTAPNAVYVQKNGTDGKVTILGGEFKTSCEDTQFLLNLYDAYRKTLTDVREALEVKGGKFYKFDPSNNASEGPGTNYVAEGYGVRQEGDWYVVYEK